MCIKNIFKRFIPFTAAFAIGLLVASFFVDLSWPRRFGHRRERMEQMQQLRMENERLKIENEQLKNGAQVSDSGFTQNDIPGAVAPPIMPAAPSRPEPPRRR